MVYFCLHANFICQFSKAMRWEFVLISIVTSTVLVFGSVHSSSFLISVKKHSKMYIVLAFGNSSTHLTAKEDSKNFRANKNWLDGQLQTSKNESNVPEVREVGAFSLESVDYAPLGCLNLHGTKMSQTMSHF